MGCMSCKIRAGPEISRRAINKTTIRLPFGWANFAVSYFNLKSAPLIRAHRPPIFLPRLGNFGHATQD
jgi:hypothetical protein